MTLEQVGFAGMLTGMREGFNNILLCYYSNLRANDPDLVNKVRKVTEANLVKFIHPEVKQQISLITHCTDDQIHVIVPKLYDNLVYVTGALNGTMNSSQIRFLAKKSARNQRKRTGRNA